MKFSPGSLFSTSEGWFTSISTFLMSDTISSPDSPWQVRAAACLALGLIVSAYGIMRAKSKMAGGEG